MVAAAVEKMIAFYDGDLHDINHFLKDKKYIEVKKSDKS